MSDAYTYPLSDYDRPNVLLSTLGSLWAETYMGTVDMQSVVRAKGQVENQSIVDLMEAINALSRYTVPIYKRDNWYMFTMRESELNRGDFSLARFDGSINFDSGSRYGVPQAMDAWGWSLPAQLANVELVMNRFIAPSMILHNGIDFVLRDGAILFNFNPFEDARVANRPVYSNGELIDREAVLWFWRGEWDFNFVYRQFGYVLGLRLQSSAGYREVLNAIFDAIVGGTTRRQIEQLMSAVAGIPLVIEPTETVEQVTADSNSRLIITDQHVYKFNLSTVAVVEVGDTVHAGDSLVDAMQVVELNRGQTPEDLHALAMGPGFLSSCYYGDLIFENRSVPLEVTEAEDDPSGFTRVRFSLGGFQLDVDRFFDEIHDRGVAKSQEPVDPCDPCPSIRLPGDECQDVPETTYCGATLAHLLDQRPASNRIGEPKASNLPRTINPLQFLIENVLRANASLIRIKAAGLGPTGLGLSYAPFLQRIVPPHTAVILCIELTPAQDSIKVDQVVETISTFIGMEPRQDAVTTVRDARKSIRVVNGNCQ